MLNDFSNYYMWNIRSLAYETGSICHAQAASGFVLIVF